jgi:hypothetical protein
MEAKTRQRMSDRERTLKKKLIALLRDDGKGHHHAKYAERLERFDVQIVPLKLKSNFTASISFEEGIIRIGEGFLNDPATFFQLNVLLRHELAHNLLMHQIRMAYKIGESTFVHTSLSNSLWQLYNAIADDEISNRKYSVEDKSIIRNMVLNGKVVGGLVTEDHRSSWVNLSIEDMYDRISEEIEIVQAKLLGGRNLSDLYDELSDKDEIGIRILNAYQYSDTLSDSIIHGTLKAFIENGCSFGKDGSLTGSFREIAEQIFKKLDSEHIDKTKLNNLMKKIVDTSPIETLDLFGDKKVVLYTPEEKYIAIEVLKKFKSEFDVWYDKVLSTLDDLSAKDLTELLDMLK